MNEINEDEYLTRKELQEMVIKGREFIKTTEEINPHLAMNYAWKFWTIIYSYEKDLRLRKDNKNYLFLKEAMQT